MLKDGWDRNAIMQAIKAEKVPCFVGSCSEIYLEKAFVARRKHPRLPVAKLLGETSLMFLVHPTLSDEHIAVTGQTIKRVIAKAVKHSALSSSAAPAANHI
jgi:dTDP-4-amino-4,6-dideoxygalactose transaminase